MYQRILTSSIHARLLAIKQVTCNSGGKTPGVDNLILTTDTEKMDARPILFKRKRGK
jgi:RNA-directed DNA polymerase